MRLKTHRAIEFACNAKACAPPPVGTGGSRPSGSKSGNTSIVPRDGRRAVAGNDAHAEAPGSNDPRAVRAYRGVNGDESPRRIPRAGETVDLYRDLGRGREHKRGFPDHDAFSVRLASGKDGNSTTLVQASTVGLVLSNARPAWANSAKQAAEVEGKRGVHAFVRGEVERYLTPAQGVRIVKSPEWQKVTYYPGTQDFFRPGDRARWSGAEQVVLVKGEFFAKNAKFVVDNPAPVSPIEKRMGLTASALDWTETEDLACHSKACAPPPIGTGGSNPNGGRSGFNGTAGSVPKDVGKVMALAVKTGTAREMQEVIYEQRGFHASANVVSREEFHDLVDSGKVSESWRGVNNYSGEFDEEYIARDLIDGKLHRGGLGVLGNGTYFAQESDTASAREEASVYGDNFLRAGVPKSMLDESTYKLLQDVQGDMAKMEFASTHDKLDGWWVGGDKARESFQIAREIHSQAKAAGLTEEEIRYVAGDVGRIGALLGVDGYSHDIFGHTNTLKYVVVLNRGAITLDRTVYDSGGITARYPAPGYDDRGEKR